MSVESKDYNTFTLQTVGPQNQVKRTLVLLLHNSTVVSVNINARATQALRAERHDVIRAED